VFQCKHKSTRIFSKAATWMRTRHGVGLSEQERGLTRLPINRCRCRRGCTILLCRGLLLLLLLGRTILWRRLPVSRSSRLLGRLLVDRSHLCTSRRPLIIAVIPAGSGPVLAANDSIHLEDSGVTEVSA
jgi:hypothetical protein